MHGHKKQGNIIIDGRLIYYTKRESGSENVLARDAQREDGAACYDPKNDYTYLPAGAEKHHSVLNDRITLESKFMGNLTGRTSKIVSALRNYLLTTQACQLPNIQYVGVAFNIKYNFKRVSKTKDSEVYKFTLLPKTNILFKCWGKNKFVDGKTGKFDKVYLEQMYDIFPKTFKLRFYRTPTPRPRPEAIEKKAVKK